MKIVARIFAAIMFVLFFGFALKNSHEVTLRFFMGSEWHTPLALLLLGFFAAGAILGVLGMTPTIFRFRREISKQKAAVSAAQKQGEAQQQVRTLAPKPDGVASE